MCWSEQMAGRSFELLVMNPVEGLAVLLLQSYTVEIRAFDVRHTRPLREVNAQQRTKLLLLLWISRLSNAQLS